MKVSLEEGQTLVAGKFTLDHQITGMGHEIARKRQYLDNLVKAGKTTRSAADLNLEMLESVLKTLLWLQRNSETVKAAVLR